MDIEIDEINTHCKFLHPADDILELVEDVDALLDDGGGRLKLVVDHLETLPVGGHGYGSVRLDIFAG